MPNRRVPAQKNLKTHSQTSGRPSIVQPATAVVALTDTLTAEERDTFLVESENVSFVNPHVAINFARTGRADRSRSWDSKQR